MNTLRPLALALLLVPLAAPVPGRALSLPIQIDGEFADWTGPGFATDAVGDGGTSGIDFTRVDVANDEKWLFLRFDTTAEVQPDEGQDITLAIDTDLDAGTGAAVGPIGAELLWNFGTRSGVFFVGTVAHTIAHEDLDLFVGPTVSDTQFEVAIDRHALPYGGSPLFPGNQFRFVVYDGNATGDLMDASATPYTFDSGTQPVPSLSFARAFSGDIRLASYNVQDDGLFAGGSRADAQNRLFDAIDPDVWVITEVWSHTAAQVAAQVESYLPSGPGESWHAVKLDSGNAIVSRFPVLGSWLVLPGSRITAVLLDPRPALDSDLLVVANHWSCCTADGARQDQADALVSFLRDARTPGGALDLAADTPILVCGDFNLVGWRQQLETLITGDIVDNGTFGPDSPPDWDGSSIDVSDLRHPDARLAATWWDDGSSFYPGRLDWIFYTGSALSIGTHLVAETRSMTPENLTANGLLATDTRAASDHAPVFADFRARGPATGMTVPAPVLADGTRLAPVEPNPLRGSATVRFTLGAAGPYRITVHDVAGRIVRVLGDGAGAAGSHTMTWNGLDAAGRPVAAGLYFVRLRAGDATRTQRAVVVR